jgi:hypothetical protein
MVKIFNDRDDAREILQEIMDNGIAGICGGRMAVRNRLKEVARIAYEDDHDSIRANSTINHPATELAYPYDETRYEHQEARQAVEHAYDSRNMSAGK